ncbi:MAG TPA: hypothetical protein VFG43_05990, partial [Geminicoccaceae bacterium]|nr:hypothetical protein [Geminicoccaceae bacterium]
MELEAVRALQVQGHGGLAQAGAGDRARRKAAGVEVERAAGGEDGAGVRATQQEHDAAVAHVGDGMVGAGEGSGEGVVGGVEL